MRRAVAALVLTGVLAGCGGSKPHRPAAMPPAAGDADIPEHAASSTVYRELDERCARILRRHDLPRIVKRQLLRGAGPIVCDPAAVP